MAHKPVWFWKDVYPLLVQFCRREGVPFNEVVNRAVQSFLGQCDVNDLRLKAKLVVLMREESELRRVSSCMLRSGAYLPSYAEKILNERKGAPSPFTFSVDDGKPLRALNREEEQVFRQICGRREEIAQEIAMIQKELLRDVKPFAFEGESHGHDKQSKDKSTGEGGD